MRRVNTIFVDLFNDFSDYCKTIAFDYVEQNTQIDYKVETIQEINANVSGNYLVTDENKVYDENLNLIFSFSYKDKFAYNDTEYFIDEFNKIREIGIKWNNTIFGQYGVDLNFGNVYSETNFDAPAIYLMFKRESGLNPLEREHIDNEKELYFDIGLVVSDNDIFDNKTDYEEYSFYQDFVIETIYNYFNDCSSVKAVRERITNFVYDNTIIEENRPLIRGLLECRLIYF